MSVLITGMEMPTSCQNCFASDDGSRFCKAAKEHIPMLGKPKFCPLVLVPPHGRLIDADALRTDWLENGENEYVYDTNAFLDSLDYAPTIIPADPPVMFYPQVPGITPTVIKEESE